MPGYLVVVMNVLKIPVLGGGGGKGVIVERETGERTYVKVSRMEVGKIAGCVERHSILQGNVVDMGAVRYRA